MLSDYGIENAATRIADKENDITAIETPFIAHFGGDFVVIYTVGSKEVSFLWRGNNHVLPIAEFIEAWTGIVLLAEPSEKSGEPEYKEHRKKERLNFLKKAAFFSTCTLILLITYINQLFNYPTNQLFSYSVIPLFRYSVILLFNLTGVYISYLLVLKQMHIHSRYADKICSLFSKSDCNNVLESEAAKLWGVFGWSEIGLGYFSANVVLLLFLPQTISLLALINIVTLPYSFWSVWYQKVKAKQWCPLCLIVQVLLWSFFILNCIFGHIHFQLFNYSVIPLFFIGSIYAIFVFGFNLLIPNLSRGNEVEQVKQEINAIKADEAVFKALLTQQTHYDVSEVDSQIIFGNPDANLKITILTNPFCNPCAKMHKRVKKMLQDTNRKVSVQYILSSFNADLEYANRYLIAVYLQKEQNEFEDIIAGWFEKGKSLKEVFFDKLQLVMNHPAIETEFQKHEAWREKTQIRATPTIFVNGYKLPDNYKIEDLRNFTEFKSEPPSLRAERSNPGK
jgi:protein-disulfide isomerase/uncharacterized membrane protein